MKNASVRVTLAGGLLLALTIAAEPALAAEYWLRAEVTTVTMPGGVVIPMWAFGKCPDASFGGGGPATACDPATVPGPALVVPPGEGLTVHLKNNLPADPISLVIAGQAIPTRTGTVTPVWFTDAASRRRVRSFTHETAAGGVEDYSWPVMKPGTYLYHSGTHPQVQVQMGLYGAATKNHLPGEAYPGFFHDVELTLLYSEIDPVLHAAVSGGTYGTAPGPTSTLNYVPKYFLINGKPYTSAALPLAIVNSQQRVLLRFINAGLRTHVPVLNGLYMQMVAEDGNPYAQPANPRQRYSVFLPAGKTSDTLLKAQVNPGDQTTRYVLFDRMLDLTNDRASDGGMLTFLDVNAGAGGGYNPPTITSVAPTTATQGVLYSYQVVATDPDPGTVLAYSLGAAPVGMKVNAASGLVTWTPSNAQALPSPKTNTATVRATDPTGLVATQTFNVAVTNVNDPPVAVNNAYTMVQGSTLNVAAPGVLGNDSDPDGDAITAVLASSPASGTLAFNADGSLTYSAATSGTRTFTYQAKDPTPALSNIATVTITVNPNRAPVATADTFTAPVRRTPPPTYVPAVLNVLANDSDPDTALDPTNKINPATVTIASAPNQGGAVVVNSSGTITYTPKVNFRGTENFSYRVKDNLGAQSNAASVRMNVQ